MSTVQTYDSKTIFYHWLSAGIVLALWLIGQNIDSFAKGDPRVMVRSIHIALGVLLGLVFLLRLKWRLTQGVKLPQATAGVQGKMAVGVHHVLYLLLGLTIVVGMVAVWIRGDNIFNLFHVPAFDLSNQALRKDIGELHEVLANGLLFLGIAHGLMAVWHHKIVKDGVLKRMWPRLK